MKRAERVPLASTNRDMAALRHMCNFAIRQGYITKNPVTGVRFLPKGPGFMRVVSHEEQKRYLDKARPLL
jgi:site-specific recombinase XerC